MTQLELPEEMADVRFFFEGDADVFTLPGLDDDQESIGLRASPTLGREHFFLDRLDSMPLGQDASSNGFLCHTSGLLDFPRYRDLGAALDQPVLNLDSEDDSVENGGEEMILDF
jgi:hypothetical protein